MLYLGIQGQLWIRRYRMVFHIRVFSESTLRGYSAYSLAVVQVRKGEPSGHHYNLYTGLGGK